MFFCNEEAVKLFIGDGNKIATEIETLLKMKPPVTFSENYQLLENFFIENTIPKKKLKEKVSVKKL